MFNKNYLFIFISILLAFIISCFYNKNIGLNFLMIFIVLSLFFYIVFYYLGSTKESYADYDDYNKFYTNNYNTYDDFNNHILRDHLEESENVEEEINQKRYKNNFLKKYLENQQIEEELNNVYPSQIEEEVSNINPQQIQEEVNKIPYKPDINKILLENPIDKTISPININISYNSQNSINELDNNEKKNDIDYKPYRDNTNNKNKSKNLGSYCDNSRVYNNSDWIYGSNAWTNDPDYYIPNKGCSNKYEKDNNCITEVPQPLNELINTRKYKENKNVCPLMINTPWTEYKTGDSEPEPYNL